MKNLVGICVDLAESEHVPLFGLVAVGGYAIVVGQRMFLPCIGIVMAHIWFPSLCITFSRSYVMCDWRYVRNRRRLGVYDVSHHSCTLTITHIRNKPC